MCAGFDTLPVISHVVKQKYEISFCYILLCVYSESIVVKFDVLRTLLQMVLWLGRLIVWN